MDISCLFTFILVISLAMEELRYPFENYTKHVHQIRDECILEVFDGTGVDG